MLGQMQGRRSLNRTVRFTPRRSRHGKNLRVDGAFRTSGSRAATLAFSWHVVSLHYRRACVNRKRSSHDFVPVKYMGTAPARILASSLSAQCSCTSAVMLRAGRVVCATCDAPLVLREHAAHVPVYSTVAPASYPPGCPSRRSARERIREVHGHVRSGTGRATVWSVDAEIYRVHYSRSTPKTTLRLVPQPNEDDEAAVEAALAASGARLTRHARAA